MYGICCNLIRTSVGPSDQLHRRGVGNQVLKITTTAFEESLFQKLLLVVLIEDSLHGSPESFLPLENCLLGDHIRSDLSLKTSLEKQVGKFSDIVIGVVVDDNNTKESKYVRRL